MAAHRFDLFGGPPEKRFFDALAYGPEQISISFKLEDGNSFSASISKLELADAADKERKAWNFSGSLVGHNSSLLSRSLVKVGGSLSGFYDFKTRQGWAEIDCLYPEDID